MNSLSQVVLKYKKYDLHVSIYQQNILYVYLYKNEKKTLDVVICIMIVSSLRM